MNEQDRAGNFYMIDTILTTLVTKHSYNEDYYLKLVMTVRETCLIGGYTAHSHKFGMNISTGNTIINKLTANRLKNEQTKLHNLGTIILN